MNFTDPQLQKCYESNLAEAGSFPGEERQVRALIATHEVFLMFEGAHSSRVHETIEHLLLPGLRPELRRWYQRTDAEKDLSAVVLRDHLSQLAGEKLESTTNTPDNNVEHGQSSRDI
ncbi:MAG TPA: hypothetical protein VKA67_03815 [Verrucomicrobiae bacterium]|nr:hypothetical protein [Verrucomicrobiae bacterium]